MNEERALGQRRQSRMRLGFLRAGALTLVIALLLATPLWSQRSVRVRGYIRRDGTYVAPHYRSAPDRSFYNNWSTKGNTNPDTGKRGTKTPRR